MAVYVPLYDLADSEEVRMAVRPLTMFTEVLTVGIEIRLRFCFAGTEAVSM
jgi:hypothetical protein